MLQDTIFNSADFLRLLGYTRGTLDMRTAKGEIAYAFGCPINAHVNEYLAMDAVALMTTSMLSVGIGMKNAATTVREHWEKWLELVQRAERNPTFGQTILPPSDQLFIVVAISGDDDPPIVATGTMLEAMAALSAARPYANIFAVSIQRVLHQLRTNARLNRIDLPKRFTVQPEDADHAKWREEIAAYRKLALARFKARANAKKVKVRAE